MSCFIHESHDALQLLSSCSLSLRQVCRHYVLPDGIEYHKREDENGDTIEFYLNVTDKELSFSTISGDKLTLEPYGVKIF